MRGRHYIARAITKNPSCKAACNTQNHHYQNNHCWGQSFNCCVRSVWNHNSMGPEITAFGHCGCDRRDNDYIHSTCVPRYICNVFCLRIRNWANPRQIQTDPHSRETTTDNDIRYGPYHRTSLGFIFYETCECRTSRARTSLHQL